MANNLRLDQKSDRRTEIWTDYVHFTLTIYKPDHIDPTSISAYSTERSKGHLTVFLLYAAAISRTCEDAKGRDFHRMVYTEARYLAIADRKKWKIVRAIRRERTFDPQFEHWNLRRTHTVSLPTRAKAAVRLSPSLQVRSVAEPRLSQTMLVHARRLDRSPLAIALPPPSSQSVSLNKSRRALVSPDIITGRGASCATKRNMHLPVEHTDAIPGLFPRVLHSVFLLALWWCEYDQDSEWLERYKSHTSYLTLLRTP